MLPTKPNAPLYRRRASRTIDLLQAQKRKSTNLGFDICSVANLKARLGSSGTEWSGCRVFCFGLTKLLSNVLVRVPCRTLLVIAFLSQACARHRRAQLFFCTRYLLLSVMLLLQPGFSPRWLLISPLQQQLSGWTFMIISQPPPVIMYARDPMKSKRL